MELRLGRSHYYFPLNEFNWSARIFAIGFIDRSIMTRWLRRVSICVRVGRDKRDTPVEGELASIE